MLIAPPSIPSPSAIIPGIDGTLVVLRRLLLSGLMVLAVMCGFATGGAHAALSGDSSLAKLVVTPGVLDFDISTASRNYTACVPVGTTSATINPVVTHPQATVRVNGAPVPPGDGGVVVDLANGGGQATVEVTAEDSTSSAYTVTIITGKAVDTTYTSGTHVPATYPALDASGLPLQLRLGYRPEPGADLKVVDITGLNFIKGRFSNLAQGQEVTLDYDGAKYHYCADYYGGTGNDLVLHWLRTGISAWGYNSNGQLGNDSLEQQSRVPIAVANAGALAGKTVVSISTGWLSSYALCSDGTIAAWGRNSDGELGNGSVTSSSIPVAVTMTGVLAGKTVVSISAGNAYCLALCSDGTVAGWGYNSSGKIGDGGLSGDKKITPVMVSNTGVLKGKTVVAVSAGMVHSLALCSDGTVAAWGLNMKGALGVAAPASSNVPVLVETSGVLAGRRVVGISADGTYSFPFSLAVCSDGRVVAWGANEYGQLGNGGAAAGGFSPTLVDNSGVLSGRSVIEVSTGETHVVARCADGTVATWGGNIYGQLGNNSIVGSPVPLKVDDTGVLSGKEVTSVVAGEYSSLALCSDGSVVGWGINTSSQLGDNSTTHRRVPVLMAAQPDGGKVKAVSAGYYHGMALSPILPDPELTSLVISEGALTPAFSPGTTSYLYRAQMGVSRFSISAKARDAAEMTVDLQPLPAGTPTEVSLKAGMNTAVVRVSAANGAVKDYTIHILVGDQMGISFDSPSVFSNTGSEFDFSGITADLKLNHVPSPGADLLVFENTGAGFISGAFQNLAQGQTVNLTYAGVTYPFVVNYYGGSGNDLVLHWAKRRILGWGAGTDGRLGNGGKGALSSLVVMVDESGPLAGKTVVAIASKVDHGLALCSDGTVFAWGNNTKGQLGDGTTTSSSSPVAVDGSGILAGKKVVAISAGNQFSLALCSDGTLASWGSGALGQLGNGGTTDSAVPVGVDVSGVLAGKKVIGISAGSSHGVALSEDGSAVAWGSNGSGQLGNGTITASLVPVAVIRTGALTGRSLVSISTGTDFTVGLCSDGKMVAWGANASGQLGNSSTANSRVPVPIPDYGVLRGKKVTSISAGAGHCLARCEDGTLASWGANTLGQLGVGGNTSSRIPMDITGTGGMAGRTIMSAVAGGMHNLAFSAAGEMAAWGNNANRQLSVNSVAASVALPEVVRAAGTESIFPSAVVAASLHSMALGGVVTNTKLADLMPGSGSLVPAFAPNVTDYAMTVPPDTTSITFRPSTLNASALIKINGVSVTSGATSGGIALTPGVNVIPVIVTGEDGTATRYTVRILRAADLNAMFHSETDIPASFPLYDATGLSVAFSLKFAPPMGTSLTVIDNTGLAFIRGQFKNLSQGQVVNLSYGGVTYHFVANYYGGTGNDLVLEWAKRGIAAWGQYNGLGTAGKLSYRVPEMVDNTGALAGKCVVSVAAGARSFMAFGLALCADGSVIGWGDQGGRQSVYGDPVLSQFPGVLAGKRVIAISSAHDSSLVLFSDGTMATSRFLNYYEPVPAEPGVLAGKSVASISKGGNHILALCSDGTIAAWGYNNDGQLGNGTTVASSVPVAVVNTGALYGKTVTAVTTTLSHSLALCSDGTLVAWGDNAYGQLGDNSTMDSSVPVVVSNKGVLAGKRVVALSQGAEYMSLVLCSDGTLASWGLNSNGQLGRGTAVHSNRIPGQVNATGALAGKKVVSVSSGWRHNIATCSDGTVVTWGDNQVGQLGRNTGGVERPVDTGELYGRKGLSSAAGMQSIVIVAEADSGYPVWAAGFVGVTDKRPSADPDGDGVPNLVEYVLGGNPGVFSKALLPVLSSTGDDFIFNFTRIATLSEDVPQVFQYSADMVNWVSVEISATSNPAVTLGAVNAGGKQSVTVTIPKGDRKAMFGRLLATRP